MRLDAPEAVLNIIKTIEDTGHEAWVVGGCVRDFLMGRQPSDWDIATSAAPQTIIELFDHTVPTGIHHGTVSVIIDHIPYEVTTFRTEGTYSDSRRPDSVAFVQSLEEDLSRRDFTVNALAWHPAKGFKDCFAGLEDLENRVIRTVGDPNERFGEDALRMLRAVRFAAGLNFKIEEKTLTAIQNHGPAIHKVSAERVRIELDKWVMASAGDQWFYFKESGLMAEILPELAVCFETPQISPWHVMNVGNHSLKAASEAPLNRTLRWALLLHDIGKPLTRTQDDEGKDHFIGHEIMSEQMANHICERLKFDNKTRHRIQRLILYHDRDIVPTPQSVRRGVRVIGEDLFKEWVLMRRCDLLAQNPSKSAERIARLDEVEHIFDEMMVSETCLSLQQLAVNGWDLMELEIPVGPIIGIILKTLLEEVVEEPSRNNRAWLLAMAQEVYQHYTADAKENVLG